MTAEWLFITAGWLLLLAGVFVAWRWGWHDPGRKTRRCPKCWYDMSATAGIRCPECGGEATSEKKLFGRRRRKRWIAVGFVILFSSWFAFRWPDYQKNGRMYGVIAFVPRTGLILLWPAIVRWEEMSYDKPAAWWAKSNPRLLLNLLEPLRADRLWGWQAWLHERVCVAALNSSNSSRVVYTAAQYIAALPKPAASSVDAFMTLYVDPDRGQIIGNGRQLRAEFKEIDPRWVEPVAQAAAWDPWVLHIDPGVVGWLVSQGRSVEDLRESVTNKVRRGYKDEVIRLLLDLDRASVSPEFALRVFQAAKKRKDLSATAVLGFLLRSNAAPAEFVPWLDEAFEESGPYSRITACMMVVRRGRADKMALRVLEIAENDVQHGVCFAGAAGRDVLLGNQKELALRMGDAARWVHDQATPNNYNRDYIVTAICELAAAKLVPNRVAIDTLLQVVDSALPANWYGLDCPTEILLNAGLDRDPEFIARVARLIDRDTPNGDRAWSWYRKHGGIPREVLDAAKRALASLPEPARKLRAAEIDEEERRAR